MALRIWLRVYTADTYYGYDYQNGKWVVDSSADASNALYQVPIIKVEDLSYDIYDVVITPEYTKDFDHHYDESGEEIVLKYIWMRSEFIIRQELRRIIR